MTRFVRLLPVTLFAILFSMCAAADDAAKADQAEQPKTIAELTAKSERVDGLFNLFRDPKTGDFSPL